MVPIPSGCDTDLNFSERSHKKANDGVCNNRLLTYTKEKMQRKKKKRDKNIKKELRLLFLHEAKTSVVNSLKVVVFYV